MSVRSEIVRISGAVAEQEALIEQIEAALEGKAGGSVSIAAMTQEEYDALAEVSANTLYCIVEEAA